MKFKTENSEKNNTPYSDAVELNEFIQFSGMLGLDENGLVEGGIVPETEQIFKNLKANLDYYNLDFSNIVKSLVMIKNMDDFPEFNKTYLKNFDKPYPVRSAFGVADLLLMFIYAEVFGMVAIYFRSHVLPVIYPLFIGITALARLIVLQGKESEPEQLIFEAGAILLLSVAALMLRNVKVSLSNGKK